MEDDTLNNILNLLQNANNTNVNDTNSNTLFSNNDIQTLFIKYLLSGGLNQLINLRKQNTPPKKEPEPTPQKPRTIDLTNYQRLD